MTFLTKPLLAAATMLLLQPAFAQSLEGSYTIDSDNPTSGRNFTSFNDAVAALTAHGVTEAVVFDVVRHTYTEQVIIPSITGVSRKNNITFEGNGATLQFTATASSQRATFKLDGADFITIRNLKVTASGEGASQYGYGLQLINDADNNTVESCTISVSQSADASTSDNYAGILLNSYDNAIATGGNSRCDSNYVTGNLVSGGYHGIAIVANSSTDVVYGNHIDNNRIQDFFRAGIYLDGNVSSVITGNDISRPNRSTAGLFYGIQLQNSSSSLTVSNNRIHDPFGGSSNPNSVSSGANGIICYDAVATAGNENIFSNNLIYNLDCGSIVRGIWISGSSSSLGSPYNKFIHNTVYIGDSGYSGFAATSGFEITAATNLTILNNIVDIGRNSSFVKRYGITVSSVTGATIGYNNITINPGSGTGYTGRVGSTDCSTISKWAATSGDLTSIAADPEFTDAASGDLLPDNTALQAGAPISATGVSTDILDLGRDAGQPTIGAFEIGGTPLPVLLTQLKANRNLDKTNLSWSTLAEHNNHGFYIQSSTNARDWTEIGFMATKAEAGNSSTSILYNYTLNTDARKEVFFRLRQQDIDGQETLSNVVALQPLKLGNNDALTLYPNPAKDQVTIQVKDANPEGTLTVTDAFGRIVVSEKMNGATAISLDIENLAPSVYYVTYLGTYTKSIALLVKSGNR